MSSEYWVHDQSTSSDSKFTPLWSPQQGVGFEALSEAIRLDFQKKTSMPDVAFENWQSSVIRTAQRCLNPQGAAAGSVSQLVVGRVQAGKTASFTGLIRLLADNAYRIFVVVAGTSTNLRDQTYDRLSSELAGPDDIEVVKTGPNFDAQFEAQNLIKKMRRWTSGKRGDSFLSFNERSVVFVALKSTKAHLDSLVDLFTHVRATAEGDRLLGATPSLIIDDEADQASPNGKASKVDLLEMTAVYKRLSVLRKSLSMHSFVGYTATPYANVLMDLASEILPESITMLNPGHDYTGAMDLFWSDLPFPHIIDDFEDSEALPESLKIAFATFICQAIIFHCRDEEIRANYFLEPFLTASRGQTATMLVHSTQLVKVNQEITHLLRELRNNWAAMFQSGRENSGRIDLAEEHIWRSYFEPALADLENNTGTELPREVFREAAREMLLEIEILSIVGGGDDFPSDNTSDGKPLWKSRMAWVLVGGQLLDRGQTLPNLVLTYMPRSPGGGATNGEVGGQFDTLQQRGRFYGHRRTYRKILRGWFSENTLETYREIALAEQQHYDFLSELDEQSIGLADTQIMLEKGSYRKLNLVRRNVLSNLVIERKPTVWLARQIWYAENSQPTQKRLLGKLISDLEFEAYSQRGSKNSALRNYRTLAAPEHVLDTLNNWGFLKGDLANFEMAVHVLTNYVNHETPKGIEVVLMSRDEMSNRDFSAHSQFRSASPIDPKIPNLTVVQKIKQLPSSNDVTFTSDRHPTLQVHFIDVKDDVSGETLVRDAIGLAVSLPAVKSVVFRGVLNES